MSSDAAPQRLRIEQALREDHSGEYKQATLSEFQAEADRIRGALEQGVDPQTYQKGEALLRGLQTACRQVERFWGECHGSKAG